MKLAAKTKLGQDSKASRTKFLKNSTRLNNAVHFQQALYRYTESKEYKKKITYLSEMLKMTWDELEFAQFACWSCLFGLNLLQSLPLRKNGLSYISFKIYYIVQKLILSNNKYLKRMETRKSKIEQNSLSKILQSPITVTEYCIVLKRNYNLVSQKEIIYINLFPGPEVYPGLQHTCNMESFAITVDV